jgi:hypothetical protein
MEKGGGGGGGEIYETLKNIDAYKIFIENISLTL